MYMSKLKSLEKSYSKETLLEFNLSQNILEHRIIFLVKYESVFQGTHIERTQKCHVNSDRVNAGARVHMAPGTE